MSDSVTTLQMGKPRFREVAPFPWVAQPVSGKPVLELGSVLPHEGGA